MLVLRYLRREKEIAEARFEVAQAESTRLRQQFEQLQKQLNETTTALTEEREKIEVYITSLCNVQKATVQNLSFKFGSCVGQYLTCSLNRLIVWKPPTGPFELPKIIKLHSTVLIHRQTAPHIPH